MTLITNIRMKTSIIKRNFFSPKHISILFLCITLGLVYIPFAKFPFKFLIISLTVLLFVWIQDKNLKELNFKKLKPKNIFLILGLWALLELGMDFIFQPLVTFILNEPVDYSAFKTLKGNTDKYLEFLFGTWISAAIGEELLYRGFIFTQLKK